jgi:hypothetical protein
MKVVLAVAGFATLMLVLGPKHAAAQALVFKDAKWPEQCGAPNPSPVAQNLPENLRPYAALNGWWANPDGSEALCYFLVLTEVTPAGDARAQYSWGSSTMWNTKPGSAMGDAKLDGDVLTVTLPGGNPISIKHAKTSSGWSAEYRRGQGSIYKAKHVVEGK